MIYIFALAQLAATEKLRIVDKVHAYANERDEQIPFGPTVAPPLAYKPNHLFDADAPCLDFSDTIFKSRLGNTILAWTICQAQLFLSGHLSGCFSIILKVHPLSVSKLHSKVSLTVRLVGSHSRSIRRIHCRKLSIFRA